MFKMSTLYFKIPKGLNMYQMHEPEFCLIVI